MSANVSVSADLQIKQQVERKLDVVHNNTTYIQKHTSQVSTCVGVTHVREIFILHYTSRQCKKNKDTAMHTVKFSLKKKTYKLNIVLSKIKLIDTFC